MDEKKLKKAVIKRGLGEKNKAAMERAFDALYEKRSGRMPALKPAYAALMVLALSAGIMAAFFLKIETGDSPGLSNNLGGVWCTYSDTGDGGYSQVWPPASTKQENNFTKSSPGYGDKGYAVRITGTTGAKLGWDYIGVLTFLSPQASCPSCEGVDISAYRGIRFMIKGSAGSGRLYFVLPYESREYDRGRNTCQTLTKYADYETDITSKIGKNWSKVEIDFRRDLKQPSWSGSGDIVDIEKVLKDARLIKWHYKGSSAAADIWIDEMEFY